MEIFLVTLAVFCFVALILALAQRWRGAPMPVGCTPVNGRCCMEGDLQSDVQEGGKASCRAVEMGVLEGRSNGGSRAR